MSMKEKKFWILSSLLLTLILPLGVFSASFNVNPVFIFLQGNSPITSLILKNEDTQKIRFQLSAFSWTQNETNPIVLHPTSNLIFFPRLLSLNPGESRTIRVGLQEDAPAVEKTYRLMVRELPPFQPASPNQIRMLLQVSIPVFFEPFHPLEKAVLSSIQEKRGKLFVFVHNAGNVHFSVETITAKILDENKKPLFSKTITGWYVLAGQTQRYAFSIPATICPKGRFAFVEAKTDRGEDLKQEVALSSGGCAP
jgi:fimbrial chaperone protein